MPCVESASPAQGGFPPNLYRRLEADRDPAVGSVGSVTYPFNLDKGWMNCRYQLRQCYSKCRISLHSAQYLAGSITALPGFIRLPLVR